MLTLRLILPSPPHHHQLFHHRPPTYASYSPNVLKNYISSLYTHTPHNLLPSDYIPCYTLSFLPYVHPSSSYSWPSLSPHSSLPSFPYTPSIHCKSHFLPYIIQALSSIHIFYIVSSQLLLPPFHSQYASWFSNALPTLISWYYAYKLRNKFPYISHLEFHRPYP